MKLNHPILWLDLEATGLDAETEMILEVGAVLWAGGIDEPNNEQVINKVVRQNYRAVLRAINDNEFVRKMHSENGLLQDLQANNNAEDLDVIESLLVHICEQTGTKPVLAGNSVHFDRAFIRIHMPLLDAVLHHRHLDVSGPFLYGTPEFLDGLDTGTIEHRALADVRRSILTLAHIRSNIYTG